jgi:hypothetical protein
MRLTVDQKEVLNRLIDKYENSKTYHGTNQLEQSFAIAPTEIWKGYESDFADVSHVRDFESEIKQLQEQGLIRLQCSNGAIVKILACKEKFEDYYAILQRREKSVIIKEQIEFFSKWMGKNIPVVSEVSQEQLSRIEMGKKPLYEMTEAEIIFKIIEFIQKNTEELLERELSILLLSDSKKFEKSYRSKVCKLLMMYMDFSELLQGVDDAREKEQIVLEEFNIYANPSYVYLKGRTELLFEDGSKCRIAGEPVAFSSRLLQKLSSITVQSEKIMTVENLTSFHRMNDKDCFYLFLSGYHNTTKQSLLKRIAGENPHKAWYHFGDLDPDGFYILEHLKNGTGIEFKPFRMDIDTLKSYRMYGKALENNDRIKAKNLIHNGMYKEILNYMLDNDCKLEQEIVSLRMSFI